MMTAPVFLMKYLTSVLLSRSRPHALKKPQSSCTAWQYACVVEKSLNWRLWILDSTSKMVSPLTRPCSSLITAHSLRPVSAHPYLAASLKSIISKSAIRGWSSSASLPSEPHCTCSWPLFAWDASQSSELTEKHSRELASK